MVLRKYIFFLFILFTPFPLYTQSSLFWKNCIQEAFVNNPEVSKIKNNYQKVLINEKQNSYSWLPKLQIEFPESIYYLRSDSISINNQYINSYKYSQIISPATSFSVNQRLPFNGEIHLNLGYQLYYIPENASFLQQPTLSCEINQRLAKDFFSFKKDPYNLLINENLNYETLIYLQNLYTQLQQYFNLLSRYDYIKSEIECLKAEEKLYAAKERSATKKYIEGMQSNLEAYYSKHQLLSIQHQLSLNKYEEENIKKELFLLNQSLDYQDINNHRKELLNLLSIDMDNFESINNILYLSLLKQTDYRFLYNEINFKPLLYFSTSIIPNNDLYYYYTDWNSSWRNLLQRPYKLDFSSSLGVRINLETAKAKKLRRMITQAEKTSITSEQQNTIKRENKEFYLLKEQLTELESYIEDLQKALTNEQTFRMERNSLFLENIISEEEFLESEVMYSNIYRDFISTFWQVIDSRLKIIKLSTECKTILTNILGELP